MAGAVLCAGFVQFSWQAQGMVRLQAVAEVTFRGRCSTLCGLCAVFVAGTGHREVARCGGGDISWQVQYFVRVGDVDVQISWQAQRIVRFVNCGGGECRCEIGIGV